MLTIEQIMAEAEALAQPVATDAPAGRSPNGEERYLELRTTVEGETTASANPIDWAEIARSGTQVIRELAKDLFALAYTAYALFETRGVAGLAIGTAALDLCIARYWDGMFPPVERTKARATPMTWLIEHAHGKLAAARPTQATRGTLAVIVQSMGQIRDVYQARLAAQAPDFAPLMATLATWMEGAPDTLAPGEEDIETPIFVADPGAVTPGGGVTLDAASHSRELAATWLVPIPGPAPAGEDPMATADFGLLQREVDKLQGINPGAVDVARIIELATGILTRIGKDLRTACYLAFALQRQQGLAGLAQGLAVVAEMIDAYWADLYPPAVRIRPRVAPVAWLLERVVAPVQDCKLTPEELPAIEQIEAVLRRFLAVTRERFTDQAPTTRPLAEAVGQLRMSLSAPMVDKPTPAKVTPGGRPEPSARTATTSAESTARTQQTAQTTAKAKVELPAADVTSLAGVDKFLKAAGEQMMKAAAEIRGLRPADPLAYRLLRIGGWLHIHGPISVDVQGSIGVVSLADTERQVLQSHQRDRRWEDLLRDCEKLFRTNRFLLDLHRLTVEALRGLGGEREAAAQGVILELRNFLNRVPVVTGARDGRGRPLADDSTRAWIEAEVLVGAGPRETASTVAAPVQQSAPNPPVMPADDDQSVLATLRSLGRRPEAQAALPAALAWVQAPLVPRVRFSRRLALAETCIEQGDPRLGMALFMGLVQDVKDHRLDTWDPPLAARCLGGLIRAAIANRTSQGGEERRFIEESLGLLTRVDPARAAQLADLVGMSRS